MAVVLNFIRNWKGRRKGYSGCHRCGGTWDWKEEHSIPYAEGKGMFPLCVECYEELSPQERYDYCMELRDSWGRPADEVDLDMIARYVGLKRSEPKEAEG